MHPGDNCIPAVVESMTTEQVVELLVDKIGEAGLFEDEDEATAAYLGDLEGEYEEFATVRQSLAFLPTILENVAGCDSMALLQKLLEAPLVQTVRFLQHMLGEFKGSFCHDIVIGAGINTRWTNYLEPDDPGYAKD